MDCLEGLKQIESESIDCVITDPPYGLNYISNWYKNGNPHQPIANDQELFLPLDELWRVLKPTGAIFAFYSHKKPLIDPRVKNVIIWSKNNWTAGDLDGDFGNQYECLAFIPKSEFSLKSKRYSNVWNFNRVAPHELVHPTQKPEALIRRIVESATEPGQVVLDPFMGSGTTAVVCKRLRRRFIGFEICHEYIGVAERRLRDAIPQRTLLDVFD